MDKISTIEEFNAVLKENIAILAYFSHEKCNVCKVLKPKITEHFTTTFPKFKLVYVDVEKYPELSAANSIFTVPVIVVYFEGKESFRKARSFGIQELSDLVQRPYNLIFN
ncbi:MAG: thioredoxin family protein [Salinivirgaceae bacterium]|nr:thioredoxin family protein [Salinivirgaceae bacterium]